MSDNPSERMTETSFRFDPKDLKDESDLQPREVRGVNLELEVAAAAMRAAKSLNKRQRKNVVEVTRENVTLAKDGGTDISVRYDERVWETPGKFLNDFYPRFVGNLEKR